MLVCNHGGAPERELGRPGSAMLARQIATTVLKGRCMDAIAEAFHSIPFHSIPFHSIPFHSISSISDFPSGSVHFVTNFQSPFQHRVAMNARFRP
jgi:hypothetical protein